MQHPEGATAFYGVVFASAAQQLAADRSGYRPDGDPPLGQAGVFPFCRSGRRTVGE
jgi:hypothetical protein